MAAVAEIVTASVAKQNANGLALKKNQQGKTDKVVNDLINGT